MITGTMKGLIITDRIIILATIIIHTTDIMESIVGVGVIITTEDGIMDIIITEDGIMAVDIMAEVTTEDGIMVAVDITEEDIMADTTKKWITNEERIGQIMFCTLFF